MPDLWQLPDPCRRGSTGKKGLNRGFKADMLIVYGTVAVDIGDKMKGFLWQLDLLHLQRGG
jgi:hypothetical protein